ncbi:MAG: FAD-binding protein, partial [Pseudomonadota bacterium]
LPSRAGRDLIDALRTRAEVLGIDIICNRHVPTLFTQDDRITGALAQTPDGSAERIGCDRLILATNGFGGNRAMVHEHMPQIEEALWFGHDGNRGEAMIWGAGLGADLAQMGAFQGHGNVAHPHGILITWAVITGGGIQVNQMGQRFWDESQGYSEAARAVLAQPGGEAWAIFDARIAGIARQFADFTEAEAQGAIVQADSPEALAAALGLPEQTFTETLANRDDCPFGRDFSDTPPLTQPLCGVRVTGALFHTQGGLRVDARARVLRHDGGPLPNLYAGGGAAVGVSGAGDSGYLSGNGLLAAVVLGRIAGQDWPDAANPLD